MPVLAVVAVIASVAGTALSAKAQRDADSQRKDQLRAQAAAVEANISVQDAEARLARIQNLNGINQNVSLQQDQATFAAETSAQTAARNHVLKISGVLLGISVLFVLFLQSFRRKKR